MSKGSWQRKRAKDLPDKHVAEEWDRLFPKKKK